MLLIRCFKYVKVSDGNPISSCAGQPCQITAVLIQRTRVILVTKSLLFHEDLSGECNQVAFILLAGTVPSATLDPPTCCTRCQQCICCTARGEGQSFMNPQSLQPQCLEVMCHSRRAQQQRNKGSTTTQHPTTGCTPFGLFFVAKCVS